MNRAVNEEGYVDEYAKETDLMFSNMDPANLSSRHDYRQSNYLVEIVRDVRARKVGQALISDDPSENVASLKYILGF